MTVEEAREFQVNVLGIVSQIPRGKVTTYGNVAALAGWPSHSRMVGRTLRYTPGAELLPCHRVVNKEGRTAPGWSEHRPLLEAEGDKTKASEFYERLVDVDPKNSNALQKLAEFRESIGDIGGTIDYLDKLKIIDPRNQYLTENYDRLVNGGGSGDGIMSFFKNFFGSKMR